MPQNAADKVLLERIDNDFTHHPPKGNQVERYQQLRMSAKDLALLIVESCPDCRERSTALTKLEEAVMWANAGVARHDSSD